MFLLDVQCTDRQMHTHNNSNNPSWSYGPKVSKISDFSPQLDTDKTKAGGMVKETEHDDTEDSTSVSNVVVVGYVCQ